MMWYYHKYFPRVFYKKYDGGKESGVVGYFLIEWKLLFSIGLLRFSEGSRESYHSHAFNAITWWLSGEVEEQTYLGEKKTFVPSFKPKITLRTKIHRVFGKKTTWALTFRGPWNDEWREVLETDKGVEVKVFTHGRKVMQTIKDSK